MGTADRGELDIWWRIGLQSVGRAYRLVLHCRYAGLEHIPAEGPAILAANHVSLLDPIAVALGASGRGRAIRFLAASEFFGHPVWGPGLRILRQIPIRRGTRDLAALDELAGTLRDGGLAGIFPEGRITDGRRPLRGRSGVTRVARAGGVPVVPVGLWGTQARWPRARGSPLLLPLRRTHVAVAFGPAIEVDRASSGTPNGLRTATAQIMREVEDLMLRARGAVREWDGPGQEE